MLRIDGTLGEGGGQILRSSLALSIATGEPFRIERIRAGRAKPGLLRQHRTAVRAAAEVSGAEVDGAELGSTELTFRPGSVRGGDYTFAVGSAGSATLVLQTILVPLLLADAPSTVAVEGGTHNPWAPPFDFLARSFLPELAKTGAHVDAKLVRPGFHPAGGGRLEVRVHPVHEPLRYELLERGAPSTPSGRVLVANLAERIGAEERRAILHGCRWSPEQVRCEHVEDGRGPGNVVTLELPFANVTEVVTAFGERGVPARRVGRRAAGQVRAYLAHDAPVGEHLADQLLLPLALLAGGTFRTHAPSKHTTTNAFVLRAFLGDVVRVVERAGGDARFEVDGAGPRSFRR